MKDMCKLAMDGVSATASRTRLRRLQQQLFLPAAALLVMVSMANRCDAVTSVVLHTFSGTDGAMGSAPAADTLGWSSAIGGLALGNDGNFYGTTPWGGTTYTTGTQSGDGTAYQISSTGAFNSFHSFTGPDGWYPTATMTLGSGGVLYGTTDANGSNYTPFYQNVYGGTIYALTPGAAPALSTVYNFTKLSPLGVNADGSNPVTGVTWANGSLYGTCHLGGNGSYGGTFFNVTTAGVETTLTEISSGGFINNSDGRPIVGANGNLYGCTYLYKGGGYVYEITPDGATQTNLHQFMGTPDGSNPAGPLTLAPDGFLYGVTQAGGSSGGGTVFKISQSGTGYQILYTFDTVAGDPDGYRPAPGLTLGSDGNLYGATEVGTTLNGGVAFSMTTTGVITILHTFGSVSGDGLSPLSPPVEGPDGNMYGTCAYQGNVNGGFGNGLGTVYQLQTNLPIVGPTTTAALSGPAGVNGWYTGSVSVTLNAAVGTFPIGATHFTVDGGPQQNYTGPFNVTGDLQHTITYWSVDIFGNTEAAHSQSVNIDGTLPTVAFGSRSVLPNAAGWNKTAVSIPYTASDAMSGLASATPGSPLTFTTQGANQSQSVTATDFAGNVRIAPSPTVNIDLTAPVTKSTTTGLKSGSNYIGKVTTSLSATDNLSGVAATYYTVNGGAKTLYSTPIVNSKAGTYKRKWWSVDKAGNTEAAHSSTILVAEPIITALTPPSVTHGSAAVTITITGSNFLSGAKVKVSSTTLASTFMNSTSLKITVPSTSIANPGTLPVSVINPSTGGTSNSVSLTVN